MSSFDLQTALPKSTLKFISSIDLLMTSLLVYLFLLVKLPLSLVEKFCMKLWCLITKRMYQFFRLLHLIRETQLKLRHLMWQSMIPFKEWQVIKLKSSMLVEGASNASQYAVLVQFPSVKDISLIRRNVYIAKCA